MKMTIRTGEITQAQVEAIMSYFGSLSKGKAKTMTEAALRQRRRASKRSAAKRKEAKLKGQT